MSAELSVPSGETSMGLVADAGLTIPAPSLGFSEQLSAAMDEAFKAPASEASSTGTTAPGEETAIETAEPEAALAATDDTVTPQDAVSRYGRYRDGVQGLAKLALGEDGAVEFGKLDINDRFSRLAEALQQKNDRLAEYEGDVGIRIDAPVGEWKVGDRLDAVQETSPAHYNTLIDEAVKRGLPTLVEECLANPGANPTEEGYLKGATKVFAEQAYQRPVQEINAVMSITRGMTAEQVNHLLTAGLAAVNGQQAPELPANWQPITPGAYGAAAPIYGQVAGMAQQAGLDPVDPNVQPFVTMMTQVLSTFDRQFQEQQQRVADMQRQLDEGRETQHQQSLASRQQSHESRRAQLEQDALSRTLKDRVPAEKQQFYADLIDARTQREIAKNSQLQQYKRTAEGFIADGLDKQAERYLGLYASLAEREYQRIASDVLRELIPSTNGTPARSRGLTTASSVPASIGQHPQVKGVLDKITSLTRPSDVGRLMDEMTAAMNQ